MTHQHVNTVCLQFACNSHLSAVTLAAICNLHARSTHKLLLWDRPWRLHVYGLCEVSKITTKRPWTQGGAANSTRWDAENKPLCSLGSHAYTGAVSDRQCCIATWWCSTGVQYAARWDLLCSRRTDSQELWPGPHSNWLALAQLWSQTAERSTQSPTWSSWWEYQDNDLFVPLIATAHLRRLQLLAVRVTIRKEDSL